MKYIISLIIVGITFSCSVTRKNEESKGKIFKSITEASYSPKRSGEMTRHDALKNKIERQNFYNENGDLVEYLTYDLEGVLYERAELMKNKDGKLIKSMIYNEEGSLKSYTVTEFDDNGRITEYKSYDSNDELISVQISEYDINGNQVLFINTSVKSNRTFRTSNEYNSKNQLIKKIDYIPDGTIRSVRTFSYDSKGNEIESELTRPNGDYTKFISEYDELNNLTDQKWYDADGKQKHQTSFVYKYEGNNNWITKKRFSNGELGYVWEREIEYY